MSKSMTPLTVPARAIAAVSKWASVDPDRAHIHMVLFNVEEYVATDGHRMVIVPYLKEDERIRYDGAPFGVDAKHLQGVIAARHALTGSDRGDLVLTPGSDGRVTIKLDVNASMVVPLRDSSAYPRYTAVPPKGRATEAPHGWLFNPKYLAAIGEVTDATSPERPGVRITAWDDAVTGPMAFESAVGIRFIVMPMRDS